MLNSNPRKFKLVGAILGGIGLNCFAAICLICFSLDNYSTIDNVVLVILGVCCVLGVVVGQAVLDGAKKSPTAGKVINMSATTTTNEQWVGDNSTTTTYQVLLKSEFRQGWRVVTEKQYDSVELNDYFDSQESP